MADWYDEFARASVEASSDAVRRLVGDAVGRILDLGCGTGLYTEVLADRGRVVIGLDVSFDQVARAGTRNPCTLQADAAAMPLAASSIDVVAAIWLSTDVDDLAAVAREAARVLVPGGRFFLFGVHPCFNGPCVEGRSDGSRVIHPTYRQSGWHQASPWWSHTGVRRRVGMRHLPLADLFNAVIQAGLQITCVEEPRDDPIPSVLALLAQTAGTPN